MDTAHLHILKVGKHADGNLNYINADSSLLQELAENYSPILHEAPIVLGHSSHQEALGETDSTPSFGWVKRLYTDPFSNDLFAECDLTPECMELLKKKYYKKKSVSLYDKDSPFNPTPGKVYVKHIALLGAHPPAVKGLQDIVFSEFIEMEKEINFAETTPEEILNNSSEEFLKFQIADGSNGYKGEISRIEPTPSEDNNWLYDIDDERFSGQFIDDNSDEKFDFEISKSGKNWIKSFKPVTEDTEEELKDLPKDEEDTEMKEKDFKEEEIDVEYPDEADTEMKEKEPSEEKEELSEEKEELSEEKEEPTESNDSEAKLLEKIKELEAKVKEKEKNEDKKFVEKIYSEARINNSTISSDDLLKWYSSLPDKSNDLVFSEDYQTSLKEFAQKVLESLTPIVEVGEMEQTSMPVVEDEVVEMDYSAPYGAVPDNSQLLLHNKAMKYMDDNGLDKADPKQYIVAVKLIKGQNV